MENNLDKLFRDSLRDKHTPFDKGAWERFDFPGEEDRKRSGIWWWFGLIVLMIGGVSIWFFVRSSYNEEPHVPVKRELAENNRINSANDSEESNEKVSESFSIQNNIENDSQDGKQRNEIQRNEDTKVLLEVHNNETDKIIQIPESLDHKEDKEAEEKKINHNWPSTSVPFVEKMPRELIVFSPIHGISLALEYYQPILTGKQSDDIIRPVRNGSDWKLSGLLTGNNKNNFGAGLMYTKNWSKRVLFRSGVTYNYFNENDQLIALEHISNYGFGRSITERKFISRHLHVISLPVNMGIQTNGMDVYSGIRVDYLAGVRGIVSSGQENESSLVNGWIKEYGYNRISLEVEAGFIKGISRRLQAGIRIGYPILSRYNLSYFNSVGIQLNGMQGFNFSLQVQYDLIR